MPATSPSPQKRPSMAERSSSNLSLSSSARATNANTSANANKGHRVHVVNKHSRNVSHGKGLNKLGKVASTTNIVEQGRQHQRKKSGPVTPTESPKTPVVSTVKRNSSHAALAKNTSHVNLRKNVSAGALSSKRNKSSSALLKLGAQPKQKGEDNGQKQGFFELGDESSGEEDDEEEWEDSTTQSPEMSRNQSKASTPLRPQTPNGEPSKPPDPSPLKQDRVAQLSETAKNTATNRSAPNIRQALSDNPPADPVLLQGRPRSSRAPPAMSTISAQIAPKMIQRTDSGRSISNPSQKDSRALSMSDATPGQGTISSGSGGVSHFLQPSSVTTVARSHDTGSEDDSSSEFMANYKPQISDSPEKPRSMFNKVQPRTTPSRTNQKMELQRREIMRAGAAASNPPVTAGMGLNAGSTISLHSRSGSRAGNRNRSIAGEIKALKQDYQAATKQLTVVRRFRNPVLDSLHRLQEIDALPANAMNKARSTTPSKSRPQSRRGFAPNAVQSKVGMARSPEGRKVTSGVSGSDSRARSSRVQFQLSRQGSHDDIGLTTSQDPQGELEDEHDGISPEEALIRRMWNSRVILENDGVQTAS